MASLSISSEKFQVLCLQSPAHCGLGVVLTVCLMSPHCLRRITPMLHCSGGSNQSAGNSGDFGIDVSKPFTVPHGIQRSEARRINRNGVIHQSLPQDKQGKGQPWSLQQVTKDWIIIIISYNISIIIKIKIRIRIISNKKNNSNYKYSKMIIIISKGSHQNLKGRVGM